MPTPPKFSVLVLTYTRSDLLQQRLSEIALHCRGDFEVIVGDNDSPNRQASLVASSFLLDGSLRIRTGRFSPNVGFGHGFNSLLALADGEYRVCLSDDVKVTGDFITRLDQIFITWPNWLVCQRIVDWPGGWNEFDGKVISYPEGYFLAAHKDTWDKLGGFDQRYYPSDYEDVDLGYTARSLDISIAAYTDLPLVHIGAQTVGHSPERMAQTNKMRSLFAAKWNLPLIPERL